MCYVYETNTGQQQLSLPQLAGKKTYHENNSENCSYSRLAVFCKKKEEKLKLNLKIHGIEEGTKKIEHELYRNKMGLVLDISLHILLNTRVGYNTTTDQ